MQSSLTNKPKLPCSHYSKCSLHGISQERLIHMIASSHTVQIGEFKQTLDSLHACA